MSGFCCPTAVDLWLLQQMLFTSDPWCRLLTSEAIITSFAWSKSRLSGCLMLDSSVGSRGRLASSPRPREPSKKDKKAHGTHQIHSIKTGFAAHFCSGHFLQPYVRICMIGAVATQTDSRSIELLIKKSALEDLDPKPHTLKKLLHKNARRTPALR